MSYPSPEQAPTGEVINSIDTLLEQYEKPSSDAWLIKFHDLPEGITAYNASKVFKVNDVLYMLVRTEGERPDQEFTSRLAIFSCGEDGRDCYPSSVSNLSEITEGKIAQDPAIAYVGGGWVVTWNEVEPIDLTDPSKGSLFKSVVAVGTTLDKLERIAESEYGTKGVRFVDLIDGRIGFTTRTSNKGKYKMCFGIVNSHEEITTKALTNAKEIKGLEGLTVYDNSGNIRQWTGPNELQLLANGNLSMLFHVGLFKESSVQDNREYDAAHCVLEIDQNGLAQAKYPKIIARAEDTNITVDMLPPKRPDLAYVMYPSCIIFATNSDVEPILLSALRDMGQIGQKIPDPLEEWRADHLEFADNPFPQSTDWLTLAA